MGLENVYTNAIELSVAWAFTGADRWRGPPNTVFKILLISQIPILDSI
jgi:hypothetical protein